MYFFRLSEVPCATVIRWLSALNVGPTREVLFFIFTGIVVLLPTRVIKFSFKERTFFHALPPLWTLFIKL